MKGDAYEITFFASPNVDRKRLHSHVAATTNTPITVFIVSSFFVCNVYE
jgi:hypothetical protein